MKKQNKFTEKNKATIEIVILVMFAFVTLLPVVFLYQNVCLTTFLVSLVSIFGILKWKSNTNSLVYLVGLFLGLFLEYFYVTAGVWKYTYTNIFNLPVWIFFVWGNIAIFLYQSGNLIKKFVKEK